MSGFDILKYREMFQEEAVELFENIDTLLLKAEEDGELSDDDMNSLFRQVHTLKGSSASVELGNFARFTHEVESFMDKLRNKQLEYQPEMASLIIDCTDAMKTLLAEDMADTLTPELFKELTDIHIAAIKEMSENGSSTTASLPQKVAEEEETFGFFDDDLVQNTTDKSASSTSPVNEAFGFFDDEITSRQSALEVASPVVAEEGFGFFDEMVEHLIEDLTYDNKKPEENFGFFEDMLAQAHSLADLKKVEQAVKKVEQVHEDEVVNQEVIQARKAHFGFFDKMLKAKQAELEGRPIEEYADDDELPKANTGTTAQKPTQETRAAPTEVKAGNSIRVDLSKIDVLMNNVGELVIVNSMLFQLAEEIGEAGMRSQVLEKLKLLDRHTRELQDSVMSVRMVPMETIYSKFPKTVRDVSRKLDKKVEFKHQGDSVEIDKAMIEGLTDPLMHIVRNSLDHGLEMPEARRQLGKPETGTIMISAEQANGQILISISDDGNGIAADKVAQKALANGVIDKAQYDHMNEEDKVMLIFSPGLSTAEAVTDLSGRGVGMDVVKTNITKLGGTISVTTEVGVGTTMTIALPLTLAILDGLNIAVGDKNYILPLASIVESLQPKEEMVKRIGDGEEELLMLRNEFIPVVRLHKLFNMTPKYTNLSDGMLIVVHAGKHKLALFVDEFLHQQQVVVKPIDKNFRNVKGVGGATVRGDGTIGLILDVLGILDEQKKLERRRIR